MLKIALAILLGGLLYRLILAIGGRGFRSGSQGTEPRSPGADEGRAGPIVDADFKEID